MRPIRLWNETKIGKIASYQDYTIVPIICTPWKYNSAFSSPQNRKILYIFFETIIFWNIYMKNIMVKLVYLQI